MKKNKGITLVALVVTIIILLILAGISIISLTGNGLFEKARLAKEKQENAQIEEEKKLNEFKNLIGDQVVGSREQITIDKQEYEKLKSNVEELKSEVEELSKNNKIHVFKGVTLVCSNGNATWTHNLGIKNYIAYILPCGGLIPGYPTVSGGENSCNLSIIKSNNHAGYSGTFTYTIIVIELPE